MADHSGQFELPIRVQPADIDELGHVNNVVYLKWVQDAAVAHWTALAPAEEQARLYWIVLHHEIDYLHAARPGEQIVAATWVGTASRLRFDRHTEIRRLEDGCVLARARTVWCPIDATTRRPAPVSKELRALFSVETTSPRKAAVSDPSGS